MDAKYIYPFLSATKETIETMLNIVPQQHSPFIKRGIKATGDVSGIIGFAGDRLTGSVSLCFTNDSAMKAYEAMVGEEVDKITPDVKDCVGELINIVAGYAKKDFSKYDIDFHISLPTIITGKNHTINRKSGMVVLVAPYESETGMNFTLEASMIESRVQK